jgi:hypothetical protein
LLAVDGSSIAPDRHYGLFCGAINTSVFSYPYIKDEIPNVETSSRLIYQDSNSEEDGYLDEEDLELIRDIEERSILYRRCLDFLGIAQPVVALLDGPLEIWGSRNARITGSYRKRLYAHLQGLEQLKLCGAAIGGYIDTPLASPVIRMLEIASFPSEHYADIRDYHPLSGVTDQKLFSLILPTGYRSAIFAYKSRSTTVYSGDLSLGFFYLNTGSNEQPIIARIEIPAWVMSNEKILGVMHAQIIDQCSLVEGIHYPYALMRAHEEAIIGFREKFWLVNIISEQMTKRGMPLFPISQKQLFKNKL